MSLNGPSTSNQQLSLDLKKMPARMMFAGTNYSPLAAPNGTATFRQFPPGDYRAIVARHGRTVTEITNTQAGFIVPEGMGALHITRLTPRNARYRN